MWIPFTCSERERNSMAGGKRPVLRVYSRNWPVPYSPFNTWKCSFSGSRSNEELVLNTEDHKCPWSYCAARIWLTYRETVPCHLSSAWCSVKPVALFSFVWNVRDIPLIIALSSPLVLFLYLTEWKVYFYHFTIVFLNADEVGRNEKRQMHSSLALQ